MEGLHPEVGHRRPQGVHRHGRPQEAHRGAAVKWLLHQVQLSGLHLRGRQSTLQTLHLYHDQESFRLVLMYLYK